MSSLEGQFVVELNSDAAKILRQEMGRSEDETIAEGTPVEVLSILAGKLQAADAPPDEIAKSLETIRDKAMQLKYLEVKSGVDGIYVVGGSSKESIDQIRQLLETLSSH